MEIVNAIWATEIYDSKTEAVDNNDRNKADLIMEEFLVKGRWE